MRSRRARPSVGGQPLAWSTSSRRASRRSCNLERAREDGPATDRAAMAAATTWASLDEQPPRTPLAPFSAPAGSSSGRARRAFTSFACSRRASRSLRSSDSIGDNGSRTRRAAVTAGSVWAKKEGRAVSAPDAWPVETRRPSSRPCCAGASASPSPSLSRVACNSPVMAGPCLPTLRRLCI